MVKKKRCPDCATYMVWDTVEEWWVCPECGNIVPYALKLNKETTVAE